MQHYNPLSKKEVAKIAGIGDEEFSFDELSQPPVSAPKEQPSSEVKKEEPKVEVKEVEVPKAEEPKKEVKVAPKPGKVSWTATVDESGLRDAAETAIKTATALFKGTISFEIGDISDKGSVEIYLNRGTHNKINVILSPQPFIDMAARVSTKCLAEGYPFMARSTMAPALANMAEKIAKELGTKLVSIRIQDRLDLPDSRKPETPLFAEAIADAREKIGELSRAIGEKAAEEGKKPKAPKEKKLDKDEILEKFFDKLPESAWRITRYPSSKMISKVMRMTPEAYAPIKSIIDSLSIPMGKAGPYMYEKDAKGDLLVEDTTTRALAAWAGPELHKLAELVGEDLSRDVSAAIASLKGRLPSSEAR